MWSESQHQILGYECPIKNVTGNSNTKIQNKNLFNPNGEFENGIYGTDGVFVPDDSWKCMTVKCKQGDIFTRSGGSWGGIVTFWNNGTFISGFNSYSLTTTIPSGVNEVKFACRYPFSGNEQLEQGSTATSYVPHEEQNYPFSLRNKNLLNVPSTFELNRFNEFLINLKAGSYIISLEKWTTSGTNGSSVFNIDGTSYSLNNSNKSITINLANDITKIYMYSYYDYNSSAGIIVTFTNLMIRKANVTDDTYEPYYEPYDIRAMQGTTLEDDGIHNIRKQKVLLNPPATNADDSTIISVYWIVNNFAPNFNLDTFKKCTHFSEIKKWGTSLISQGKTCLWAHDGVTFGIIFNKEETGVTTLAEARTYLVKHNIIVEWELAEEEIIPYNATQQAQYNARKEATSYDDITYISSESDELGFNMNVVTLISTTAPEVSSEIGFNNTNTSMQSTNVQDAIVEINSAIGDINTVLDEINGVEV